MYHRGYTLLGVGVASLFAILFLLQVNTGIFSPHHEVSVSRPLQRSSSVLPPNTPGDPTVITGGRGGVNRLPDPTEILCRGITSTPADMLKVLASGWTVNNLAGQYRNDQRQLLCYDNWNPAWVVPGGTWLNISDFLKIMGWPPDLFDPSAGTQILIVVSPNDVLKPSSSGTTAKNSDDACHWKPDLGIAQPDIDMCKLASVILKAIVLNPLKAVVGLTVGDTNSFLWTTPAKMTYLNPDLSIFWAISLSIINALLAVVLAWASLRYMMSKSLGSWLSYADLIELLPRIIMALIAAYVSARICQIVIDGSNALSSIFSNDLLAGLQTDPQSLQDVFAQIALCFTVLLLILEEAVRYAILFVLIGFGPIWAFGGALRETQFIFKVGLKALFFMSLLQPCQIAVMALGQHLATGIGGNAGSTLYLLISIGLMIFVLFMMSAFLRASGISMPFGWLGAVGLVLGTRAVGGTATRVARKGIGGTARVAGGGIRKIWPGRSNTGRGGSNNTGGGGSKNTGGGPNNTGGGGSNNTGPQSGGPGRRKVKQLPPYDPYKHIIKTARSTTQAVRKPPIGGVRPFIKRISPVGGKVRPFIKRVQP